MHWQILDDDTYGEPALLCPVCGFEYTHHRKTTIYARPSGHPHQTVATVIEGMQCQTHPSIYNPSGRRDAVVLTFECEAGHLFDMRLVQHKGVTYVTTGESGHAS